jgi:class 3 adenylate cyclase
MERKLTTIFCADVVGYSKMMSLDEEETLRTLSECRTIIDKLIDEYCGRIFGSAGDSVLAEFPSAVMCVRFAAVCQHALHKRNLNSTMPKMRFRFGIHLGDVVIQGNNLMGDVVNIAARIESMADYGGVSMSETVYNEVKSKIQELTFLDRGFQNFKNIPQPIKIYSINYIFKPILQRYWHRFNMDLLGFSNK